MTFRPLPILSVFTLAALVVLVLLGHWQWQRGVSKQDARDIAPAMVDLAGTTQGAPVYLYSLIGPQVGWKRVRLVQRPGAPDVLVADLFVPGLAAPARDALAPVAFVAPRLVAQEARQPLIKAQNLPEQGLFYWPDVPAMARALNADSASVFYEPMTIAVVGSPALLPNPAADPASAEPLPPERHFGYALTWWGLACALVGVFFAFHHAQGRLRFASKGA